MAYRKLLGSHEMQFLGQSSVDIHLTDWDPILPIRQRAVAVAHDITFISPEVFIGWFAPPGGPAIEVWIPFPLFAAYTWVIDYGPNVHLFPPQPHPYPVILPIQAMIIGGTLRFGYHIPWHHDLDEWHVAFGQHHHLHYNRHERKGHYDIPTRVAGGPHHVLDGLRFGTQINHYRRGC